MNEEVNCESCGHELPQKLTGHICDQCWNEFNDWADSQPMIELMDKDGIEKPDERGL